MKNVFTIGLISLLLVIGGCDETKKVIDVAGTVQLSGNYTVNQLGGNTQNGGEMTLTMAALDKSVRGTTGCNSFFGNYSLDLYALNFGDLAVSENYCDAEGVMENERNLIEALRKTGSYSLQNNILTLYSKADRSVLLTANKEVNAGN